MKQTREQENPSLVVALVRPTHQKLKGWYPQISITMMWHTPDNRLHMLHNGGLAPHKLGKPSIREVQWVHELKQTYQHIHHANKLVHLWWFYMVQSISYLLERKNLRMVYEATT